MTGRIGVRSLLGFDLPPLSEGAPGDPGLFGPGSEVWRIGRERVLLLAGPVALLLQLAHPLVAAGVADHSDFRRDPLARLRATLRATLTISFGDRRQAAEAAARVASTHRRVVGRLRWPTPRFPAGTPYDAADPRLGLWVHATLVWAAFAAYERLIGPLSEERKARYFEEARAFAALFGVGDETVHTGYQGFKQYVASMLEGEELFVTEEAHRLAGGVLDPPLAQGLWAAGLAARVVTAGLLPQRFRDRFDLAWGRREQGSFRLLTASIRATLPWWPERLRYWSQYRAARERATVRAALDQ